MLSGLLAIELFDFAADKGTDLLSLRTCRGPAGTDRPDRLVSDGQEAEFTLADALKSRFDLAANKLKGLAHFALFQALTDTDDGAQTPLARGLNFLVDEFVRFAKIGATLTVAENDVGHAHFGEHLRGDFAGKGSLIFDIAIFRGNAHARARTELKGRVQNCVGHAENHAVFTVFDLRQQGVDDFGRGLRRSGIHLPVARRHNAAFAIFRQRIVEIVDTGKHLAFQVFQRGSTARGNVGHLIGKAQFFDRRSRIAAPDNRNGLRLCNGPGHLTRALGKSGKFKNAHGPVPDDRAGLGQNLTITLNRFRTDIQAHKIRGDPLHRHRGGVSRKLLCTDMIFRQQKLHVQLFGARDQLPGQVNLVGLKKRLTHFPAFRGKEGIGHASADEKTVDFIEQIGNHADLIGHFRAAENGHKGAGRIFERLAHDAEFFFNQKTGR